MACNFSQVREAAGAVSRFLKEQGCSNEDVADCELALVEACNNAVQHVRDGAQHLPVDIKVDCDAGKIRLSLTDHTAGFDLPAVPQFPGPDSEGGRGIPLIQTVMDRVEYVPGADANVLNMFRRRRD